MRKYFGTDGVRGVANTELDSLLAYNLGRAGGYVLGRNKETLKVVVGKDTRKSGDMLETALISGLMSIGCDVIQLGVMPTPAVAYLTRKYNADCGVVISASHNPAEFNGIKFFNAEGFKLEDEIELEIESYLEDMNKIDCNPIGDGVGKIVRKDNPLRDYIEFLKESIKTGLKGLKVVLDCANGAASEVAPIIFDELGAHTIVLNNNPDGININDDCGSTHPEKLQQAVLRYKADIGLAYDGDADRLIAVDEKGDIVDGDKIMMLSAIHLKKKGELKQDTLVVTVMSNIGLHICAKENNINIATTSVGDKYVLEEMKKEGYSLGGEQSGHLVFLDYNTTGDGVLSSLILSKILLEEEKTISELASAMEQYPQVLVNAKVKNENKNRYMEFEGISSEIKKMEDALDGKGRVLIRPSGTEPLIRVMLEGQDRDEIQKLAIKLANTMEFILG